MAAIAGLSFAAYEAAQPRHMPSLAAPAPSESAAASGTPVLSANWYEAAPYYFVTDDGAPDLGDVIDTTGQKAFVLAFVRAPSKGGGCTPSWGGTDPVSTDTSVADITREVRAHGGGVSVSVGGGGGTALGQVCATPQATAAAYRTVLDKYHVSAIDFDIERSELQNPHAVANEVGAAQILERETPGLMVTITIPSTATGVDGYGEQVLEQAEKKQLTVAAYTIMPFDDGFHGAAAQQVALAGFNHQLQDVFGWSATTAWQHEGVSQMNGEADKAEYFSESDFASNLKFAETHHMARYTFWSMNRDRECDPPSNAGQVSTDCSSVSQGPYAFTRYSAKFAEWQAPAAAAH
jgi:chitinase